MKYIKQTPVGKRDDKRKTNKSAKITHVRAPWLEHFVQSGSLQFKARTKKYRGILSVFARAKRATGEEKNETTLFDGEDTLLFFFFSSLHQWNHQSKGMKNIICFTLNFIFALQSCVHL